MANNKEKDNDKKVDLQVVVNGTPVEMDANPNQPLQSLLVPSLKKAGVAGDPEPDRWVFKDAEGNVLDKHSQIGSFAFGADAMVFLSLEAGVAG